MKRIKLKKLLLLGAALFASVTIGKQALANEFNFSVNPVLPQNQLGSVGYFDLLMQPGAKQTITVTLSNSTDKTVVVEESIASATTNINGVVEYSPNSIKPDKTLKYNIVDYAKGEKEITLTPKSSKNVTIDVTMPNAPVQGVIAGGITFQEKDSATTGSSAKGLSIQNKYAYVVALLMQQDKATVAPDLILNTVAPGQVNYRNVINANLQNPKAGYLNQMYVQSEVQGLSNTKLDYKANKEMLQMAPNSNFDYPIAIGDGHKLEAGKYRLTMTVYGQKDSNGKYSMKDSAGKVQKFDYQWKFTRDFTISGETAQKLNAKDVTIKPDNSWLTWLIAGIALVILALLLLFFLLWKRRKKDDEDENEDSENKKETLQAQLEAIKAQLNEDNSDDTTE